MSNGKEDKKTEQKKPIVKPNQPLSSHERKFNSSAADTEEEIDALEKNNSPIDTDIEREYHGLNKTNLHSIKKQRTSPQEQEFEPSPDFSPKGPSQ